MKNFNLKTKANDTKGITLVALVISIIVLLILATVSISLIINNGILDKAKTAVDKYNEGEIEEQIKLAYLEYKTAQLTGTAEKDTTYMQRILREILNDSNLTVKELGGIYTIKLSNNRVFNYEVNVKYASKSKDINYIGCYADINSDGIVDGVIFVDLLTGSKKTTQKFGYGNLVTAYNIPDIVNENNVKTYYISQNNYTGSFGTKDVISPIGKGKDRFYVLSLSDFSTPAYTDEIDSTKNYPAYTSYYWYGNATINDFTTVTLDDFETGKSNTETMINKWKNKSYGNHNNQDIWKHIQTKYNEGWFLPSRAEWAAFANELGITSGNYNSTYGLSGQYLSSSLGSQDKSYQAWFYVGYMQTYTVTSSTPVRLATTF